MEPLFEKYRIKINPLDMHHVMAFASLYIGDSQTMAAEAGVLGVPFVRFNDFVGRIGYLRELEDKYHLGFGVHASPIRNDASSKPNEPIIMSRADALNEPLHLMSREQGSLNDGTQACGPEALYEKVQELVSMDAEERKAVFAARREKMLSDKIDCAKFLTYFIEQYPASAQEVKNATPDFWERFK